MELPEFMVWLLGRIVDENLTRKYVSDNVHYTWKADDLKSFSDLEALLGFSKQQSVNSFIFGQLSIYLLGLADIRAGSS